MELIRSFRFANVLIVITSLSIISSCSKEEKPVDPKPEPPVVELSKIYNPSTDNVVISHEFRAAWLTTAWGLDWPQSYTGATAQRDLLISLIDRLKGMNINVIFFQVRCSSDAFYKSSISPWSSYLTGKQGDDPGFDPLQVAVEEAHKRGMELHAWMNPYRIGSDTQYYAPGHPALLHPDWYVVYDKARYWNPGLPEVRAHLNSVVKEVIDNYAVDGIHFDDYFYPDGAKNTTDIYKFNDKATFERYGNSLTLDKWREKNVDDLIKGVNETIKAVNPKLIFGISPSGRIENSLALYANSITWLSNGWIDYLAPQIYWEIGHATADFDRLVRYWDNNSYGKPIFPGIAAYKFGDALYPAYSSTTQFLNQVTLSRSLSNIKGNCWYRTLNILGGTLSSFITSSLYPSLSVVPKMGSVTFTVPLPPSVSVSGTTVNWSTVSNSTQYAVYELKRRGTSSTWDALARQIDSKTSFNGQTLKNYLVIALNEREKSAPSNIVYIQ
ncbi:MAG: hypothetical protein H6Q22_791 [Bacteroidetes bacterium]|nr:hypothetical protein [Bacteroidota bacterium]